MSSTIQIIYDDFEDVRQPGEKGFIASVTGRVTRLAVVGSDQLASSLKDFCSTVGQAFQGVSTTISEFELDSFELALDITAKGEIRLVSSASTEIKGGVKLSFRRKSEPK